MAPDPQAQAYLDRMASFHFPPLHTLSPEQMREGMRQQLALLGPPEPVARIEDRAIRWGKEMLPIRIYTPEDGDTFPILVYFHGGGFVVGDLDTHDGLCRGLANGARCIVVSVAYPRAPEHKFPSAPRACDAATRWIASHAREFRGDPTRIAVGGDSAGGNLAAVVAQLARGCGEPALVFQLLIYPDLDFRRIAPSVSAFAGKYGNLTGQGMAWFEDHYLNGPEEREDPLASPLLAPDLRGLPPRSSSAPSTTCYAMRVSTMPRVLSA